MFNRIRTIRKRWLVAFTAAALLAVGLVSGAAFAADARADYVASALSNGDGHAQGNARHGRANSDTLFTRVAEILGIEKSTLDSAFETAVDEQAETRFDAKVAETRRGRNADRGSGRRGNRLVRGSPSPVRTHRHPPRRRLRFRQSRRIARQHGGEGKTHPGRVRRPQRLARRPPRFPPGSRTQPPQTSRQ